MKSISIWDYIQVGTCLRFLQDAKVGQSIHAKSFVLQNINNFLSEIAELGLYVTQRASYTLEEMKEEFEGKPKDSKLTGEEAQKLSKIMREIRLTFSAEAKGIFAYYVTDKRFDTKKLLEKIDLLFNPGIYNTCPETARNDFKEAGLCIAFELPTAAAFHILRGTEDVLRIFHKKYIRPAKKGLSWGQILHELKNKNKGKLPDVILLNNLDNIRNSFRNPTQHPEKVYDINEFQDLFSLCIDVVNRMVATK
jgi:hypothetical protein